MAFDKQAYDSQYVKQFKRQFMLKVSRIYDADIVEWLEAKDNLQTYLKDLIRKDIAAHSTPESTTEPD